MRFRQKPSPLNSSQRKPNASGSSTSPVWCARFGSAATPRAAIIWKAASEAEVREAVASLPIFKAGKLELTVLVALEPYPGFGPAK